MKASRKLSIDGGQVMVEYIVLISVVVLVLIGTWVGLRQGLFEYYRFLTTLICLPIP